MKTVDSKERADALQVGAAAPFADALEELRRAIPTLQAVYIFGSRARGSTHRESDVDLAVLLPKPLPPETRWELQEELASGLHSDVDLIDLAGASTVMQMQVISSGTVLFEIDPAARQRFEMQTLSAYALLNEERAALLNHVRERGRIYGR